jgi:hypothetical protein
MLSLAILVKLLSDTAFHKNRVRLQVTMTTYDTVYRHIINHIQWLLSELRTEKKINLMLTHFKNLVLYMFPLLNLSSVSIVTDYRLDYRGLIPGRGKWLIPLASLSKPALRSTQLPIQWVPEVCSRGQSAAGAWHWLLSPIYCRKQEWVGAILPLPIGGCVAFAGQLLPKLSFVYI